MPSTFLYRLHACYYLIDGLLPLWEAPPDSITLLYITDGTVQFRFHNRTVYAADNTVTILHPRCEQPIAIGTNWRAIALTIVGGATSSFGEETLNSEAIPAESSPIFATITDIVRLHRAEIPLSAMLMSEYLHHLLSLTLNEHYHNQPHHTGTHDIVRICARYLETHYDAPLKLDQLTKHIGISKYHLSRQFSSLTGMTLSEFHMSCRLKEAKRLLLDHSLPISTICERIGFVDMSHFTKAFKKHEGITPSQYRKQYLP